MKFLRTRPLAAALGVAVLLTSGLSARAADDPFAWPPITSQTKPWAFNWWMGSAVDKTNLTHELERYAAAGLGGIHIIPIYGAKGYEDKYIPYLSPKWMEMLGWTVSEAHRLGLGVDMTTGTGWCFGGPQVTDEDANASVVVKTFDLAAGERLKEKFSREATQALVAFSPDGKSIELTDKISADGEVDWTVPAKAGQASRLPGERASESVSGTGVPPMSSNAPTSSARAGETPALLWRVYAISQKPSGQKVKRPAPGGEGWMLNLIYPPAMDDFLKPFTAAFASYTGPKPRAQFHDSYEYRSDWSPNFFAEFEKRRGYKLQTELPALFADQSRITNHASSFADHSVRVKCDYRQTVSELMAESLSKWTQWAHAEGFITRDQAHGSPGNWLDLYAAADIPETEMFHLDRNKLISKFASSAAHVTGKPLVSAETGTWLAEHFTETLGGLKSLADDMFLSGVNHIFYHGLCYSPDEAGWPGWHFYAATEMNPRNPIWRDVPALNEYIARCQAVLQSGQPDNDILLYWPVEDFWMQPGDKLLPQLTVHARDWFEGQPIGKTAQELWDRGYAFDYVSDAQLKTAKVADGKIQMPGGKYQVIVVPECKYIPVETFKQLLALAENGATVIFENEPDDVSGLNNYSSQHAELKKLQAEIQPPTFMHNVGNARRGLGQIIFGEKTVALHFANAPLEPMAINDLSFIRRSFDGGWNYFIANRSNNNFDGWITLARPAKSAEILDPLTGDSGVSAQNQNGQIHLQLAAGESLIVRAFDHVPLVFATPPLWNYFQTNGQPVELTGPWNVKFILGGPTLPADFQTARLASWTTFPDPNTQAFAGTAKYETTFDVPNPKSEIRNPKFFLDLGDVRQSARVRVNGQDYGTLLTPPFRVVVDNLKPTGNTLEVEVTSVAANRIRDLDRRGVPWKTFRDINIVDINYKPFDAANWPLTDCGLLGPVTLTPVTNGK